MGESNEKYNDFIKALQINHDKIEDIGNYSNIHDKRKRQTP